MKDYLIEVTEKHIRLGDRHSCFDCPIAIAITEATGMEYRAVSAARTLRIESHHQDLEWPKPMEAWIVAYDKGATVTPFTFKLSVHEKYPDMLLQPPLLEVISGLEAYAKP